MDALFNKVALLLHCNGSNGSTTFIDSSSAGRTVTPTGDAQISTAQSKFGGASALFDGAGDYLTAATSLMFAMGTGGFTLEAWIYVTGGSGYRQVFSTRPSSAGASSSGSLAVNPSGGLTWFTNTFIVNYTTTIGTNQWVHVAVARSGTTIRVFANGVQVGSATNADNLTAQSFSVGANNDGSEPFQGHIDEIRVTAGAARYTYDFEPPTAEFSETYTSPSGVLLTTFAKPGASLTASPRAIDSAFRLKDIHFGGRGQIVGTVKEDLTPTDLPLRRRVQLYAERGGVLVGETWSNPTTGAYAFTNIDRTIKYFVATFDYEQNYRAVIADNLTPELMP